MGNLVWKLNRLRAMGLPEIAHRLRDAVHMRAQARGLGLARRPASAVLDQLGRPWLAPLPKLADGAACVAAAERTLRGRFDVFSLRDVELGFPPRWNRDPKTGTEAPLVFGKSLDYRDEVTVGDIKYLWEPNRHLAITNLAQAYHLTGELRYAHGVQALLESWFAQCPYPLGPNWSSALELGIRLVNWSCTWHLLGGAASPLFGSEQGKAFQQRWLDSIYQHCHFVAGYFSRHSSANNHLFGELMGLHIAALTWPCWPESPAWLAQTARELEVEALRQTMADGVNREQAIYYQHEVADMMLLCALAGRANGHERSAAFMGRLEKMLEFIAALMDVSGQLPMIGDADDALIVRWSWQADWNVYRSLLALGAVLFERADFKAKAGCFDDKSYWLLGEDGKRRFDALEQGAPAFPRAFREGGYFILGRALDTASEVRLVADAGPLGYLAIAAHGHADALSFTMSIGGIAVLVDPGTYAYHTQKKWRDYFRGTSAHNTVRVDGVDQSEPGGNFLWLRKANARCDSWDSSAARDCLVASHDGYRRLDDPVMHRRRIEFLKDANTILVEDSLECTEEHLVEWHWHFSPRCEVALAGGRVQVRGTTFALELAMPDAHSQPVLVSGSADPPLGWVAQCFDEKEPALSIRFTETISGTVRRLTVFQIAVNQALTTH